MQKNMTGSDLATCLQEWLLSRYSRRRIYLPPLWKLAPDWKGTPVTCLTRSSLLALLALVYPYFNADAIVVQKLQNEVTWTCNSDADAISQPALKHDPDDSAVLSVHGAAACSGPRSLVNHYFAAAFVVGSVSIGSDIAS